MANNHEKLPSMQIVIIFVMLQGEGNKQYVVEEEWSTVNVPMVSTS